MASRQSVVQGGQITSQGWAGLTLVMSGFITNEMSMVQAR